MRFTSKRISAIGAIAAAIAFAGCECSVGSTQPQTPPPPPPPAAAATAAPASMANPPAVAPLPPGVRERLEKKDGG